MHIKRIQAKDGAVLKAVRLMALRDSPNAFEKTFEQALDLDEASWEDMARIGSSSEESTTFFLLNQQAAQGMISAFFVGGDRDLAFISAMWVAPEHRRTGAGARLVDTAARWLAERGAPQVLAWVADCNAPALRFYENLGFLPTGEKGLMTGRPDLTETLLALDAGMVRDLDERRAA